ncbi:FAD-dependent monooxygenase [Streptomyces sp. NPDC051218]|uniref:FAD-dependent monooxygenase n=1 Tax=Streptomyces sp. NPDC051218 TaxID=3365645 RepID=UPI003791F196
MVRPIRTDVVVVGGGPVGMLLAAELSGYGVATVVLERLARTSERPKATTLHARTAQTLARRGYLPAPELSPSMGPVSSPFHFAGIPGLRISAPAGEPEPILKRAQADLERLFEAHARANGAQVLREHRVVELHGRPNGVRVVAEGPAGAVAYEADYVVGADGARGTVREWAGIPCEAYEATVSAMMGLVRLDEPDALTAGWHRTPQGWVVAKDAPDGETHVRTVNFTRTHADRDRPLTLEELRGETSQIMGRDIGMSAARWLSRFSDYARIAHTYRKDRVLLAGDAAHLHFPVGGQGLSTGLLDALNLGWKLAFTVRGSASTSLLDSYDTERRPAAERVIDNVRAQVSLMHPEVRLDSLRNVFSGLLAEDQGGAHLSAMLSAQDTVLPARSARPSPWEGKFLRNIALTTRSGTTDVMRLLRDGRLLLLLLGSGESQRHEEERYEETARAWPGVLRVVRAQPVSVVPCEALLVRPDGYIAWASDGGCLHEALAAYLTCEGDAVHGGAAGPREAGRAQRGPSAHAADALAQVLHPRGPAHLVVDQGTALSGEVDGGEH